MKRSDRKSDCAINFALEVFGDPWSMLILRDLVYFGKNTFSQFLNSDERIGTSTLTTRLAHLISAGVLVKRTDAQDARKEIYALTDRGLDGIGLLLDLADWGSRHDPDTGADQKWMRFFRENRNELIPRIRETVARGGSVFAGPENFFLPVSNFAESVRRLQ